MERTLVKSLDTWSSRVANWMGIWGAVGAGGTVLTSGFFYWVVSGFEAVAAYGWGAVATVALFLAAVLVSLVAGSLALFRYFRPLPPPPVNWLRIDHFERFKCQDAACYLHDKYPAYATARELTAREKKEPQIYQSIREFAADDKLPFYLVDGSIDPSRAMGSYLKRADLDAHFARKGFKPDFLDREGRAKRS